MEGTFGAFAEVVKDGTRELFRCCSSKSCTIIMTITIVFALGNIMNLLGLARIWHKIDLLRY